MSYRYRAFGLSINSEIELPELWSSSTASDDAATVEIVLDRVPHVVKDKVGATDLFQIGAHDIVLTVPGVGRFMATDGQRLSVEPETSADPDAVRLMVKGSGLAAVLHQRGSFPLHASAIEIDGGCIAFVGDSGAGKSTLAGMLARRGHRIVSDDVLVTQFGADADIVAAASVPLLKLWPTSLPVAGLSGARRGYEADELRKVQVDARGHFVDSELPVRRLYFLRWLIPTSAEPEIRPLAPMQSMLVTRSNVYRSELISAMGREADYLLFSSRLLSAVRCFWFDRSCNLAAAASQVDVLERHLQS